MFVRVICFPSRPKNQDKGLPTKFEDEVIYKSLNVPITNILWSPGVRGTPGMDPWTWRGSHLPVASSPATFASSGSLRNTHLPASAPQMPKRKVLGGCRRQRSLLISRLEGFSEDVRDPFGGPGAVRAPGQSPERSSRATSCRGIWGPREQSQNS